MPLDPKLEAAIIAAARKDAQAGIPLPTTRRKNLPLPRSKRVREQQASRAAEITNRELPRIMSKPRPLR